LHVSKTWCLSSAHTLSVIGHGVALYLLWRLHIHISVHAYVYADAYIYVYAYVYVTLSVCICHSMRMYV